jgi:hypothetical protein
MYEFFTEQKFNSISPKQAAKAVQFICKAANQIGGIKARMSGKEESVFLFALLTNSNPLTARNFFCEVFWRWKLSVFHAEAAPGNKILNYIRSYRDSISVYTSFPFLCFLRISPEDWYVSNNSSSKLAA